MWKSFLFGKATSEAVSSHPKPRGAVSFWRGMTPSPNEVKTVLRVCSACAGYYEDPDRSAPGEDDCDEEPDFELEPEEGTGGRLTSEASSFVRE